MMHTTAVVIGAGHAGLAMSRRLSERSIDHVVLERGEVANSWRTQRWASLRLLTPNWLTRLPGYDYAGNDPDGYLPAAGVVATLTRYARFAAAPVRTATTVLTVRTTPGGFEIQANDDILHARAVVLATGACARPAIPAITGAVPRPITTLTPLTYHDPSQLPDGGVLVIGASATGVQLAGEIHRSGRPVTLAVGEHVRLPRRYRGRDIFWWLEATGVLAERYDQVDDLTRARHLPSPQLTGTPGQHGWPVRTRLREVCEPERVPGRPPDHVIVVLVCCRAECRVDLRLAGAGSQGADVFAISRRAPLNIRKLS